MPTQKITPFLWFDTQALDAAKFYASVFSAAPGGSAKVENPESFENTPSGTDCHYRALRSKIYPDECRTAI